MANDKDQGEMWLELVLGALSKYVPPEKVDSPEELVDDMVEVTTEYANGVLDVYEEQFGPIEGGRPSRSAKKTRGRRREQEPE